MNRQRSTLTPVLIGRIVQDEKKVSFQSGDSYLLAYKEFIQYFAGEGTITAHHLIIGTHFIYGWMPTILELKDPQNNIPAAIPILNDVKHGKLIDVDELLCLRGTINNSMVGTSKLLHFINPEIYAIWDSRVYKYITGRSSQHQVEKPEN